MLFNVANSSFIFDLLLLSMTLWAVFLAILLPATLVALGCFLLFALEPDAGFLSVNFEPDREVGLGVFPVCCDFGFICMIVRERVGGGGKVKCVLAAEGV